jgi:hypothetical protein
MRFTSSSIALFAATVASMTKSVCGQQECISDLSTIFNSELQVVDATVSREYTLCPETTFEVGNLQTDNSVLDGQHPLIIRSNAKVKCGDDGSSANNCKIDGIIGTTGILLSPSVFFGELNTDNIVIQGVTVDFFIPSSQKPVGALFPVQVQSNGGDVTFLDCVFSTIRADPLFLIDHFVSESRRSLKDSDSDSDNTEELLNQDNQDNRHLQADPFTVNFKSCSFKVLYAPLVALFCCASLIMPCNITTVLHSKSNRLSLRLGQRSSRIPWHQWRIGPFAIQGCESQPYRN